MHHNQPWSRHCDLVRIHRPNLKDFSARTCERLPMMSFFRRLPLPWSPRSLPSLRIREITALFRCSRVPWTFTSTRVDREKKPGEGKGEKERGRVEAQKMKRSRSKDHDERRERKHRRGNARATRMSVGETQFSLCDLQFLVANRVSLARKKFSHARTDVCTYGQM
jgi:hypothetical protein